MEPNDIKLKHIILADDEPGLLEVLQRSLQDEGYANVLAANDGTGVIDLLKEYGERIYLVVTNLRMPILSGFDVIDYLLKSHKYIIGVIMVTGTHDLETTLKFMRLGTEKILTIAFIPKPFGGEELLQKIEEALEKVHEKRIQLREVDRL